VNTIPATPQLREIDGPSAIGGGRRRFFELLWLVSMNEFKMTYFGTVLGYFWSLIRPLLLFGVLLLVFTKIFRLGSGVPNYPVLLLLNIVLFTLVQEATTGAVTSIVGNQGILRKTQFPRLVIPLSIVLTALFNLGLNLIAVFAFIFIYGVEPLWTWLLLPVILVPLVGLTVALSMLLSALYVRFRDAAIIWSVAITILFYGTPILYPIEVVPSSLRTAELFNPLTPIFVQARKWIIDADAPSALSAAGSVPRLMISVAVFSLICFLGVWIFRREAPRIAEAL
jgi:ABC-2 type transport system permease protein